MTPVQIQDDSWPWSNSNTPMPSMTTPEYTFDLSGANESQLDGYVDTQFDSSRPGSELTTPVDHLAASPDIEGLGDESFNQLFMSMPDVEQLQLQQLVKDCPTSYLPLFAVTDFQTTTFSESIVPQQPLMVSPMEFSSDYPNITHPSLFDPFTEEEIACMSNMSNMSSLNDPSMSMSGTVPNNVSSTGPDMGMGWPMPSSTVSGSGSGYQPLLSIPPVLSSVPSTSPVPSACAPSPVNFASPSTYSPRTVDGDHTDASASASGPGRFLCSEPGCGKAFPGGPQLRKHAKRHEKPFVCLVCGKAFGSKKDLEERHMWSNHPGEAERQGIPNPYRACPAPGCSYKGRGDNVSRHINTKHPEYVASQSSPGGC